MSHQQHIIGYSMPTDGKKNLEIINYTCKDMFMAIQDEPWLAINY